MPCNEAFFTYTAGRYGLEKEYVLTNGPFLLTAWNHGKSLLLNKNENFHEKEDVYPSSVRYVIGSAEDSGDALLAGSLDAAELAPSRLSQAREENFQLTALSDTIEYVWLNNSLRVLSSAPIRRALRDALAWDILSGQFDTSYCSPAQGYVPPAALLSGSEALPHRRKRPPPRHKRGQGQAVPRGRPGGAGTDRNAGSQGAVCRR